MTRAMQQKTGHTESGHERPGDGEGRVDPEKRFQQKARRER